MVTIESQTIFFPTEKETPKMMAKAYLEAHKHTGNLSVCLEVQYLFLSPSCKCVSNSFH